MSVSTNVQGTQLTIFVSGKFDISQYEAFNGSYKDYLSGTSTAIVDLSQTDYIDSSALGMLLLLRERMGNQGDNVELVNASPEVSKVLEIANFQKLFVVK